MVIFWSHPWNQERASIDNHQIPKTRPPLHAVITNPSGSKRIQTLRSQTILLPNLLRCRLRSFLLNKVSASDVRFVVSSPPRSPFRSRSSCSSETPTRMASGGKSMWSAMCRSAGRRYVVNSTHNMRTRCRPRMKLVDGGMSTDRRVMGAQRAYLYFPRAKPGEVDEEGEGAGSRGTNARIHRGGMSDRMEIDRRIGFGRAESGRIKR